MENVNALKIRGFGTRTTRTMYFIPSWILLSILSNLAKYFNASSTEFEFTTSNMVPRIHITRLNRQLCLISCVLNKILTTKREIGWINSFLFWNKMNQIAFHSYHVIDVLYHRFHVGISDRWAGDRKHSLILVWWFLYLLGVEDWKSKRIHFYLPDSLRSFVQSEKVYSLNLQM